ncbi:YadA family autotransporter adhesin [Paraburkholderia phymatum]|uniref:YadA family autotransporter adhesin n=1 Tax=Paraburkholderia phymatum TaxID=148447 RepID=UPI003F74F609
MLVGGLLASGTALANSGTGLDLGGCANTGSGSSIAIDGAVGTYCANATGTSAIAIGSTATAGGAGSGTTWNGITGGDWDQVALGVRTKATAGGATAVGSDALASGVHASAFGNSATASANSAMAIGDSSFASVLGAAAIGSSSTASGTGATAVGAGSTASASSAVALGTNAVANTSNSVALGANSVADSATLGTAGYNPGSSTLAATAAGGEVSVGAAGAERRVTNVAAGLNGSDAVNVSQLQSENAKVDQIGANTAAALGGGSTYDATTGTVSAPSYTVGGTTVSNIGGAISNIDSRVTQNTADISTINTTVNNINNGSGIKYFHANSALADSTASGANTVAIGGAATASGGSATAIGVGTTASGAESIALGGQSASVGQYSTALGYGAKAISQNTFAIGQSSTAVASDAIAMGTQSMTDANSSAAIAMGRRTRALNALNGIAVGDQATVSANAGVAIGFNATASATNSVALGAGSTTTADLSTVGYNPASGTLSGTSSTANGEVSIGSAGAERRVTNVAAGSAATDAVNVSQLQSENAKADEIGANTAAALGGGSTYDATTGTVSAPSYTVGGTTVSNIGGAISNIDARTTQNAADITSLTTQISSGSVGLVQQDATTRNITVASATDGSIVDFTGTAGVRKLTGVAAGAVNASSVDAVNGTQLYGVSSSTASAIGGGSTVNPDGSISAPSYTVGGTTVNSIGGAVSNIDARTIQNTTQIAQNSSDITNLTTALASGEVGLVQQDPTTRNITVAKDTDGTIVDFTGTAGARRLTGVLAGNVNASSLDAVNGAQLYGVSQSVSNALGGGSSVNSDGSISAPSYTVGGTTVNSIGGAVSNIDARTTQNATNITNLTDQINSGQVGLVQQDPTTQNITVAASTGGSLIDVSGTAGPRVITGVAAGAVSASSTDAINGSQLYNVSNSMASALGGGSTVNSDGTISAPAYVVGGTTVNSVGGAITNIDARTTQNTADIASITNGLNSGTIGMVQQDQTTHNITVAKNTDGSAVDFSGTAGTRKLTGITSGDISASSTDAVTGAQAYSMNQSIANAIGGGSTVNSDGTISAPTFNVGGTTVNSIAGAVTNLDTRVTQNSSDINSINNTLTEITTGNAGIKYFHSNSELADSQATGTNAVAIGGNAKATADNSVALGANSVADRANTVSVGAKGSERQIANVAAGTEATDAVNVSQLNETVQNAMGNMPAGMTAKDYTDQRFNTMQNTVNQVAKNSYAGIAAAMAMPNLTPSGPGKTVVAAGAGSYKSGSAVGVGVTYRSVDSKWLVNGALSVTSTGDAGVRAQVGYEF